MTRERHRNTPPNPGHRPGCLARWARRDLVLAVVTTRVVWRGNDALRLVESDTPSVSIGTPQDGRLAHGKRLPSSGANFRTYSRLGSFLGRTAVHDAVRDATLAAYETLAATRPETGYVYGETGWPRGGRFRPHRTHRSGVSVDYMTPVTNREGRSVPLPTWPWLRFGYDMAFEPDGCTSGGSLCIDYPALAAHLRALHAVGHEHGVRIGRVIFAPDLQAGLFAADSDLRDLMAFSRNPSWVRHDDHIHVDFVLREDG